MKQEGVSLSLTCFCRRTNLPGKLKSTEELELEKMQQLQREVMELRKKNEQSLKAAIAGAGGLGWKVLHKHL